MKCVAIDFETANAKRSSVCAVGIALVEGKVIVQRSSWLVRPPELDFDPYNIYIHGITEDDVRNKPEFNQLWDELRVYLQERTVLAHYASFDMSVLRHVLDEYGIAYPQLEYLCTRAIAKCTWPKLLSYSLVTVSEHLGIEFRHHDPEEDAAACAEVALRSCADVGVASLEELTEKLRITTGRLYPGGYRPSGAKAIRIRPGEIQPTTDKFDPNHPFFEKTVVFTGTLQSMVRRDAMQRVVDSGGRCANSISKAVSYLVLGDQDFSRLSGAEKSSKLRKAESLIANGVDLEFIPEAEFLEMLEGD